MTPSKSAIMVKNSFTSVSGQKSSIHSNFILEISNIRNEHKQLCYLVHCTAVNGIGVVAAVNLLINKLYYILSRTYK